MGRLAAGAGLWILTVTIRTVTVLLTDSNCCSDAQARASPARNITRLGTHPPNPSVRKTPPTLNPDEEMILSAGMTPPWLYTSLSDSPPRLGRSYL